MELNSREVTTAPRPAATVMLLRDGAQSLEVFLLKRHRLSDVLGGAYVFPGGKVDAADGGPEMRRFLDRPETELQSSLQESGADGLAAQSLYVGAMRELFEECGVLLAQDVHRNQVRQAAVLLRQGHAFDEVLGRLALRLQTSAVLPWSRWITPRVPNVTSKRFDTRFFIAALPADQTAQHDNRETTESVWMTPRHALDAYWSNTMELAPPQVMSLAHLSHFQTVEQALHFARSTKPPLIAPEPLQQDGARIVCYPGDPQHTQSQRAFPGPTRLIFRNQRFEPPDGFESLFQP